MKRIFESMTILLLVLAATQTMASAQATPGLEGVWDAQITVTDCNGHFLRNVRTLDMYIHDGSISSAGGSVPGGLALPRTNAVGNWRHAQAQTFTAAFRFFGLNPDGTLASIATATRTLVLNGDTFTASDTLTITGLDGHFITSACSAVTATRLPAQ